MPYSLFPLGIIFALGLYPFFGFWASFVGLCLVIGLQVLWPKLAALFSPKPRRRMKDINNSIAFSQRMQAKAAEGAPMFKSRRTVADTPETRSIAWYLGLPSPRTYSVL